MTGKFQTKSNLFAAAACRQGQRQQQKWQDAGQGFHGCLLFNCSKGTKSGASLPSIPFAEIDTARSFD
jgi:hypothetical protein